MSRMLSTIMGNNLGKAALLDVGIQWACWVVAAFLKTEKFYDLAGSGTFLLLAYQSLQWGRTQFVRQKVTSGMVIMWAARLGFFLFRRVMKEGKDSRFNNVKTSPSMFFVYWTIQAIWIFVTLLPTLILNEEKKDRPLCWRDYVGWGLWGCGLLIEALADYQKSQFKADPANKGRFIQSGLWSISRHPNYLGEIIIWSGIFLSASSVMSGVQYASVISPLFVAFLLTKVSGIPILEKMGKYRWGQERAYQDYMKNTAILLPYIW